MSNWLAKKVTITNRLHLWYRLVEVVMALNGIMLIIKWMA